MNGYRVRKIPINRAVDMLLKLLIYLEGNWKNICKTRGVCLSAFAEELFTKITLVK